MGFYEVTATFSHADKVPTELIINGEWIETTPEHPFYTLEEGWLPADELKTGMHVRQADGEYELVWLKWNVHKTQEMYNLTVDTAHTYFVGEGQWLVHNECPVKFDPKQLQGGRYYDLDPTLPDGTKVQNHHLVPNASSPVSKNDGPAIQMLPEQHRKTASYGWGNRPGRTFRDTMDSLVSQGSMRDALAYGIRDVRRVAGSQYNRAIWEALDYARSLGWLRR